MKPCHPIVKTAGALRVGLIVLGAFTAAAVVAEPVRISGTHVTLDTPEHFVVSDDFAGLLWREAGTSVLVTELPGPSTALRASMSAEGLASRGLNLHSTEEVQTPIGDGTLFVVTQRAQGIDFHKLILVTGDEELTVMLTASTPSQLWERTGDTLRATLLGATWDPQATVDPIAALPFSVQPTADLEPSRALAGAALLVTEKSGRTPRDGGALAVVTRASTAALGEDLGAISHARLAATRTLIGTAVEEQGEVTVAGMPAYELLASATLEGQQVRVYQLLASDGGTYYMVQATVGEADWERFLPQFRELSQSLDTGG